MRVCGLRLGKREFARPFVFGQGKSPSEFVSDLYTPERLNAKDIALGINRLVNMELATEELTGRYGQRICEVASSMKAKDIAMTMNVLAKLPQTSQTSEAVGLLVKMLASKLMHFAPLEISLVLNSLAKLSIKDAKLLKLFSSEIPHKLEIFAEDNFAQTVHALARLDFCHDQLLISDFAQFFLQRVGNFNAQQLFMIANAFGRFARHCQLDESFFPTLLTSASQVASQLQPHQGPLILMAAAAADCRGAAVETFAQKIALTVTESRHAVICLSALAKLKLTSERFGWTPLCNLISANPPVQAAAVVQIFHALGKRGIPGERTQKVLRSLLGQLECFDVNQLAIVVYALKNVGMEIPRTIQLRLTNLLATDNTIEISTASLAMIGYSLALNSDRLTHFLLKRLSQARISECSAKSLGMIMIGLSTKIPPKLVPEIQTRLCALVIGHKLTADEARGLLDGAKHAAVAISEDARITLCEIVNKSKRPHDRLIDSL